MKITAELGFHIIALVVSCLWGTTFVASKILLNAGLSPAEIMCLRFAIAYIMMLPFCSKHILPRNLKDELIFIVLGLSGGSLYFLAENSAVKLTTSTSTVAMLIATTPIMTALVFRAIFPNEKLSARFLSGTFVALVGVALVIFNGVFVLDDDPWVILLSLAGSFSWAIYGLALRKMEKCYHSAVITRKVFFWGVITMFPLVLFEGGHPIYALRTQPSALVVLLFLALVASLGCYHLWNVASKRLGIVVASNYLYFNPITSLITAYLVLSERITLFAIFGCALVIGGVYLCNKPSKSKNK